MVAMIEMSGGNRTYGHVLQAVAIEELHRHAEELALQIYTVMSGLYGGDELAAWRNRVAAIDALQEKDFG